MKRIFFLSIFFTITSLSAVYSQLILRPLTSDTKREVKDELSVPSSKTSRVELSDSTELVNFGFSIVIISGNNPRCSDDNSPIIFKAVVVNGGSKPKFEWSNGNTNVGSDTSIFILNDPKNGDAIKCQVTSNSDCLKGKTFLLSNSIIITTATGLTPAISIKVSSGFNPGCAGDKLLSFTAVGINGGTDPNYEWFYYNGTTVSSVLSGSIPAYTRDSMPNKNQVYCVMTSNLSCAFPKTVTSEIITRSLLTNITPAVDLSIIDITNEDCKLKEFNFRALPINPGGNPIYSWYINDVLAGTTSGTDFSTNLKANGDEIYVQMTSSLACANPRNLYSSTFIREDTIQTLPFFDDFSTSKNQPEINRWVKKGGTYINNNLGVKPPSYNVASFDGLRYNGRAYDSLSSTSRGITDNLTSLPIDISESITAPLHLVFYWQPQGMGETPDSSQGDYLTLYFKSSNGDWVSIWKAPGTAVQPFKQEKIAIVDDASNKYRHSGFQFKFESTGRLSGMYDVWNVDYIYLEKTGLKDTAVVAKFEDQSFNVTPKPILKNYSAMPLDHFKLNPLNELRTNDTSYISNLSEIFNNLKIRADFYDRNNILLQNTTTVGAYTVPENQNSFPFIVPAFSNPVPDNATVPFEVRTSYSLAGDSNNVDGKGIDYKMNNTITGVTILDNFYAYDDGTAEYGIGINQKFGQVAYRYHLNTPDTLQEIAINILKMGIITSGQSINICVWKSLPSNPISKDATILLFKKNYFITYPQNVDGFTVFKLDKFIALADTFYIGYQQISDEVVTIGWDKNLNSNQNIFYSTTSEWINYSDEKGSMMLRPSFGEYTYLNPIEKEIKEEKQITLYPNPSSGYVCTDIQIDAAQIINLNGEMVWFNDNIHTNCFDTGNIPEGFYIVQLKSAGRSAYKKLLIKR